MTNLKILQKSAIKYLLDILYAVWQFTAHNTFLPNISKTLLPVIWQGTGSQDQLNFVKGHHPMGTLMKHSLSLI